MREFGRWLFGFGWLQGVSRWLDTFPRRDGDGPTGTSGVGRHPGARRAGRRK